MTRTEMLEIVKWLTDRGFRVTEADHTSGRIVLDTNADTPSSATATGHGSPAKDGSW